MPTRVSRVLAITLAAFSLARAQHYSFKNYGAAEGLHNLNVNSLLQDHEGFLWLGTDTRVFRYDGAHFDEYSWDAGLPQTSINSLAEDSLGHIWVGTEDGVFVLSDGHLHPVLFRGRKLHVPPGGRIECDLRGAVYVAGTKEIVAFVADPNGQTWQGREAVPVSVLKDAGVSDIHSVRRFENSLWFGCNQAVCRWDGKALEKWNPGSGIAGDDWTFLFMSKAGELWARGMRHIAVLKSGSARFTPRDLPQGTDKTYLPVFVEDAAGRILANRGRSIARWDGTGWDVISEKNGLPRAVSCLLSDREGSVWFGAIGHGLYKWLGYNAWEIWTVSEGLKSDLIWAIRRDGRGTLWVGHEHGMSRFDEEKKRFESLPMPVSMRDERIQSLTETRGGLVWAGSSLGHLARIDSRSLQTRQIPFEGKNIVRLRTDSQDRIWIAAENGLYVLSPGAAVPVRLRDRLLDGGRFLDVGLAPGGKIYARSEDGILCYDGQSWRKLYVPQERLGGLYAEIDVDSDTSVWIDGVVPGVSHLKLDRNGRIAENQFIPRSDIGISDLLLVEHDRHGRIWLGGSDGVSLFDGHSWKTYTQEDGLGWNDIDSKAFWEDADGGVWFGTSQGLSHLANPDALRLAEPLGLKLLWARFGSQNLLDKASPRLPWSKSALSLAVVPLSFRNEKEIKVKYRLVGVDQNWIEKPDREIKYPQLDTGNYRFEAVAIDSTYGRQSPLVSLSFRIDPPWWRTWWFIGSVLSGLGGAVVLFLRWRMSALLVRQQELERIVEERTEELARKKAEAEQASGAKSAFLATMSHEIRTPLNGVIGMTEMLRETALSGEQLEYVDTIQVSGESLLTIINDLLDFSKIGAGKLTIDPVPFEPGRLIADCAGLMKHACRGKRIDLKTSIDETVPERLRGDVLRLRQVILNLLSNAIKFTPAEGSVSLSIRAERSAPGQLVQLTLEVIDTGIGMSPEQQTKLFQSFSQADASIARKFGGTGLGLAISKSLIELMGGEIGASSIAGAGSTFWFRIPVPVVEQAHEDSTQSRRAIGLAYAPLTSGCRVLVAEDNIINQKVAQHLLQRAGCDVTFASDGKQAVSLAEREAFDLILMDCQMPEMDGLAATSAIRAGNGLSAKAPIVAATANVLEGERERCLRAGMDDYLSKPISEAKLVNLLRVWVPGTHTADLRNPMDRTSPEQMQTELDLV